MESILLSSKNLLIQFSEFWIEWFMNFFADPDFYWTEETYPVPVSKSRNVSKVSFKKPSKSIIKVINRKINTSKETVKFNNFVPGIVIKFKEFFNIGLVSICSVRLIN